MDNNPLSESIVIDDDIVTIYGIKYAGGLFRLLGGLLPINKLIRIIKREDGVITLEERAEFLDKYQEEVEGILSRFDKKSYVNNYELGRLDGQLGAIEKFQKEFYYATWNKEAKTEAKALLKGVSL